MWSWWDSIEIVSKFNTYMQISIVVFGFLTASATYLSNKAANRISEIQAEKESKTYKRLEVAEETNKELRAKMEHTEKVLAPPSISLESKKIERHSTGICAKLRFKSSKTDSLPTLTFKVKIIEGDSKIIGFDLDIDSPIHQNRNADNFPEISEDGKTATVNFYTLNSTKADIRIDVSAPAKAIITGKYIDSPVTIMIP